MPELPEVQTVVSNITPRVVGSRVRKVQLNRTDILTPAGINLPALLTGRTITNVARRAKRIVVTLDNANRFYIHLGMSGQLTLATKGSEIKKHTHLILHLANGNGLRDTIELRFRDPRRFGGVFWLGRDSADT